MQQYDLDKEKKEILEQYRNLLKVCKPKTSVQDKLLIRKAFNFALEAHKDMRRKSGEPYIYHPIEVAHIAAGEIGLGTTSVVCALLHDVVEDTIYTLDDIKAIFGEKVAKIIDGLTKISGIFDNNTQSLQAENFRKILLTLSDDVRVILIKLADRLHNMRTLQSMPKEKQLKISSETSYLYAPLAHRLGLYAIKSELEDLAFKYTEPEIYQTISQMVKDTEIERKKFITKFLVPIKKDLSKWGIKHQILARSKSVFSIWEKMRKKEIPFEEVYDLFAIRIIIETPFDKEKVDCWRVYSLVTDHYKPNQERLRDWISIPKANGYESLHTTVMSKNGKWVEVQIRSERMDEIAEKGYAAHWKYKDSVSHENSLDEWLSKIRELLLSPESNALDFLDDFKMNLFSDELFVFSPKGDLFSLPVNSTALDFAYSVHSQIGNNCIGAKSNHKLVPLNYILKSGDQVEIITSDKQSPKEEWLNYVITARAKSHIKDYIKEEKKKFAILGKNKLKEIFDELKIEFSNNNINKLVNLTQVQSPQVLFIDTYNDKVNINSVKGLFFPTDEKENWRRYLKIPFLRSKTDDNINKPASEKNESLIPTEKDKIPYKISLCCNPIPGDETVGFINKEGIIEIHRVGCEKAKQLMSMFGNKIIKTNWKSSDNIEFLAGIKIVGIDKLGLMNDISKVISSQLNINIRSLNLESNSGIFEGEITVYIQNTDQLINLIENLKKVDGIEKISRIN